MSASLLEIKRLTPKEGGTPGYRPRTALSYLATVSHVALEETGLAANQARVSFYKPDFTSSYDTSFMVTAFC